MDNLAMAIQKQRGRSGYQDEQPDSLDEQGDSLDSFEGLPTEPKKTFNKDQENHVQRLDVATVLSKNVSTLSLLESSSNNLSSNSANVPDDDDWETQPQSISYIYCDRIKQDRRQEKKEKGASPSATKGSGADQVSNEVQESSTVSVKEKIKNLQGSNK